MPLPLKSVGAHVFAVFSALAFVSSPEKQSQNLIPPELILQRFTIPKAGDCLLVPVTIGGKDRQFILDTGATLTVCDPSLLVGSPVDTVKMLAANGEVEVQLFDPPKGTIGSMPFAITTPVIGADMKPFREVSGYPVDGFLGLDFLNKCVLHIDCDRGELLFLKRAPAGLGEEIPLKRNELGMIEVTTDVRGIGKVLFILDTGAVSDISGAITSDTIRVGLHEGIFKKVSETLAQTGGGTIRATRYQGQRLEIGTFAVERPIFDGLKKNILGMGFLSRFTATLDFPKNRMYLRQGEHYAKADRWNRTGVHILKKGAEIKVVQVDEGSSGSAGGIRQGDVVLKLGKLQADRASMAELREVLCGTSRIPCIVRRDNTEHEIVLDIPK